MLIPSSTYRVQLHAGFNFHRLESILAYLYELGISTIYASPITKAIKGSQHGYDAIDPLVINPEIGREEDLQRISGWLKDRGMSWLQDIVPNHMAWSSENPWLFDVLERGKSSEYFTFFDIDTDTSRELTGEKIMAPFLGSTLTECLQKAELKLDFTHQGFLFRYYESWYPIAIDRYEWIVTLADGCPPGLLSAIQHLQKLAYSPAAEWTILRQKALENIATHPQYMAFLRHRIDLINRETSLIAELAGQQHYILTHAHLAATRINYRRFFTVNGLICLRMEEEKVFANYHQQIQSWYNNGYIQGLRLDHIDGLASPRDYIDRLRRTFGKDCYVIAEKILEEGESLPDGWDLQGTTGYEFLSAVNQSLCDADGSQVLLAFYKEHIAGGASYEEIVFEKKHHYLLTYMGGELDNLLALLYRLPLPGAETQNKERLRAALALLLSSLPVYRIYPDEQPLSPESRLLVAAAFELARKKGDGVEKAMDYLESIFEEGSTAPGRRLLFQIRLMQFTGPLAAKGVEDTTFYVYEPYIAHNEVGDTPSIAGTAPDVFHKKMQQRLAKTPHALNATTTHDTKRGEDARIRLNWLSAIPEDWITHVNRWCGVNRPLTSDAGTDAAPTRNDEYLIYQSLLGGFPDDGILTDNFRRRFHDYYTKALREGSVNTSYDRPNEEYEKRCHAFITAILQPDSAFLEDFTPFAWQVIHESSNYSLSQILIKLTAPGIPDIYQGAESWETSFVDPDNRRPVDYPLRISLLKAIKEEEKKSTSSALLYSIAHSRKGALKLFVTYRTLAHRNAHPAVYSEGDYLPIPIEGPFLSYIRRTEDHWVLIVVPLVNRQAAAAARENDLPAKMTVQLPAGAPVSWLHAFTGDTFIREGDELRLTNSQVKFPVALLIGRSESA